MCKMIRKSWFHICYSQESKPRSNGFPWVWIIYTPCFIFSCFLCSSSVPFYPFICGNCFLRRQSWHACHWAIFHHAIAPCQTVKAHFLWASPNSRNQFCATSDNGLLKWYKALLHRLPQGGLEILCKFIISSESRLMVKVQNLLSKRRSLLASLLHVTWTVSLKKRAQLLGMYKYHFLQEISSKPRILLAARVQ